MLFHLKTLMLLKVVFFLRSRSGSVIKPAAYLDDYVLLTDDSDENLTLDRSYSKGVQCAHGECRWVFKIRRHDDKTIEKIKARFVAQGCSHDFGSDYDEIFAPTAKLCTLRIRFALAASWSTFVFQLDVRSAFLNGNLSDEIYIEQPEGFAQVGAIGETLYLQDLLTFFCLMTLDEPVLLCGDNQRALALASNSVAHKRAKHIETRHLNTPTTPTLHPSTG